MGTGDYEPNSVVGKYISSCEIAKQPLNDTQIGLLEKTINEVFGVKNRPLPAVNLFRPLDEDTLSTVTYRRGGQLGRIINILKEYRVHNLELSNDLPLSEADAWSLYSLTAKEIGSTTYKDLKERHGLPKTYGFNTFAILHKYFAEKEIVEKDSSFPFPKDF